jgi:succinate dehydrogenase/fumarate reductase flavoprotein subunit/uncharacterized protein with FMN-binding domain
MKTESGSLSLERAGTCTATGAVFKWRQEMKKWFNFSGSIVLVMMVVIAGFLAVGCSTDTSDEPTLRLTAGAYTGEAVGFHGTLEVEAEVTSNEIIRVTVLSHNETVGVGDLAVDYMKTSIVLNQSLADTVSGATFSGWAVKNAVADALQKAGATEAMISDLRSAPILTRAVRDTETDIVVVGAGEAGMLAAMSARDEGARVILLEKTGIYGGSTSLSAGAIWFLDTADDSIGAMMRYTKEYIRGLFETTNGPIHNDPVFDAIVDGTSEYGLYLKGNGFDHSIIFAGAMPGGTRITSQLYRMIEERGIDVRFQSPAVGLLKDGGTVTGVRVQARGGSYNIRAKKVILATGGFSWDRDMLDEYAEGQRQYAQTVAAVGGTGDGHKWGLEMGGVLLGEGILALTGVSTKPGSEFLSFTIPMSFLVNKEGEKFVDGNEYYVVQQQEIIKQTDGEAYVILGSDGLTPAALADLNQLIAEHHAFTNNSLAELAGQIGVNAETLATTVAQHNGYYDAGTPDEFGTPNDQMYAVKTAPYYAFRRSALIMGTIAGLKVDPNMRVVNGDDAPIPNLYATGELIFGNIYNGRYPTSGTANTTSMSSGRIAGKHAAAGIQ